MVVVMMVMILLLMLAVQGEPGPNHCERMLCSKVHNIPQL